MCSRYDPHLLLYAGSGFDKIPKYIFGESVVIHLSLEETERSYTSGYFRVLQEKGILIFDNGNWTMEQVNYFFKNVERYFCDTILAPEFCDPNNTWREITDTQRNIMDTQYNLWKSGCGTIIGYSHTLARTQDLLNFILSYHRSITAQCFCVFKKR